MAKETSSTRSCAWFIIKTIQLVICVMVLALSMFLLISYMTENDIYRYYDGDAKVPTMKTVEMSLKPSTAIFIMIGVTGASIVSSIISLITYCCHRLSIKLVVFCDFFLSLAWIAAAVFMSILLGILDGWKINYWVINLYKLDVALAITAALLYITSGALGIRLHNKCKKKAIRRTSFTGSAAAPYIPPQQFDCTIGTPYQTYSNPNTPPPNYRPSGEWESVGLDQK